MQLRALLALVATAGATAAAVVLLAAGGLSPSADRGQAADSSGPGAFMLRLVTAMAAER